MTYIARIKEWQGFEGTYFRPAQWVSGEVVFVEPDGREVRAARGKAHRDDKLGRKLARMDAGRLKKHYVKHYTATGERLEMKAEQSRLKEIADRVVRVRRRRAFAEAGEDLYAACSALIRGDDLQKAIDLARTALAKADAGINAGEARG